MTWKATTLGQGSDKSGGLRDAVAQAWSRVRDLLPKRKPPHRTVAFTIAVTTLAAKMAKADGVALPIEEQAFERMFGIPPHEASNIRRLYDLATKDVAGYDAYASKIARLLQDEPELLRSVLECLFYIAAADGVLHPDEDAFLEDVAAIFGIPHSEFFSIRCGFVQDPECPYTVMGVTSAASDDELKARHRALVREHHPDRLAASGIPAEFRAAADRRLAAINAAYDLILKQRAVESRAREESHS